MPQWMLEIPEDDTTHVREEDSTVLCLQTCFCLDLVCFTSKMKRYCGSVHCSFYGGNESVKVGHRVSTNIIGIIGHKLESSLHTRTCTALLSPSLTGSRDCVETVKPLGIVLQRLLISLECLSVRIPQS